MESQHTRPTQSPLRPATSAGFSTFSHSYTIFNNEIFESVNKNNNTSQTPAVSPFPHRINTSAAFNRPSTSHAALFGGCSSTSSSADNAAVATASAPSQQATFSHHPFSTQATTRTNDQGSTPVNINVDSTTSAPAQSVSFGLQLAPYALNQAAYPAAGYSHPSNQQYQHAATDAYPGVQCKGEKRARPVDGSDSNDSTLPNSPWVVSGTETNTAGNRSLNTRCSILADYRSLLPALSCSDSPVPTHQGQTSNFHLHSQSPPLSNDLSSREASLDSSSSAADTCTTSAHLPLTFDFGDTSFVMPSCVQSRHHAATDQGHYGAQEGPWSPGLSGHSSMSDLGHTSHNPTTFRQATEQGRVSEGSSLHKGGEYHGRAQNDAHTPTAYHFSRATLQHPQAQQPISTGALYGATNGEEYPNPARLFERLVGTNSPSSDMGEHGHSCTGSVEASNGIKRGETASASPFTLASATEASVANSDKPGEVKVTTKVATSETSLEKRMRNRQSSQRFRERVKARAHESERKINYLEAKVQQLEAEILRLRCAAASHAGTAAMHDSNSPTSFRNFTYNGETALAASSTRDTDATEMKLQNKKRNPRSDGGDLQATITLLTEENQMLRRQLRLAEQELTRLRDTQMLDVSAEQDGHISAARGRSSSNASILQSLASGSVCTSVSPSSMVCTTPSSREQTSATSILAGSTQAAMEQKHALLTSLVPEYASSSSTTTTPNLSGIAQQVDQAFNTKAQEGIPVSTQYTHTSFSNLSPGGSIAPKTAINSHSMTAASAIRPSTAAAAMPSRPSGSTAVFISPCSFAFPSTPFSGRAQTTMAAWQLQAMQPTAIQPAPLLKRQRTSGPPSARMSLGSALKAESARGSVGSSLDFGQPSRFGVDVRVNEDQAGEGGA